MHIRPDPARWRTTVRSGEQGGQAAVVCLQGSANDFLRRHDPVQVQRVHLSPRLWGAPVASRFIGAEPRWRKRYSLVPSQMPHGSTDELQRAETFPLVDDEAIRPLDPAVLATLAFLEGDRAARLARLLVGYMRHDVGIRS